MARRLFARAVETPGGLKIETLHALCERLLHMFPFEANVPARFVVLDEAKARELFDIEMANVLADAVSNGDTPLSAALWRGSRRRRRATPCGRRSGRPCGRASLIGDRRPAWRRPSGGCTGRSDWRPRRSAERIEAAILEGGPGCRPEDRAALIAALRTGKANDEKLADALAGRRGRTAPARRTIPDRAEALAPLPRGLLHPEGRAQGRRQPRNQGRPGRRQGGAASPSATGWTPLFDRLRAARAHARTQALFQLAAEIHRRVEAQKARLGALRFR
ncbi:hypothetical protein ACU4GR_07435 [Methylobacterium oryzae CBMB20]